MTGKTVFARHLLGEPHRALETNCAACPEPDLRRFKPFHHEVIVFDEATCKMVLQQRKLFQAPAVEVELGCSTTNCYRYRAFVSGVRMVICSNTWVQDAARLPPALQDWLRQNSYVLEISEPMFADSQRSGYVARDTAHEEAAAAAAV